MFITKTHTFKFKYDFVSLFAPLTSSKITVNSFSSPTTKKILVKQSYLILAWFKYFATRFETNGVLKDRLLSKPSYFVKPIRSYKTTLIKAPMAHKTFSQEQFLYNFYVISMSFNLYSLSNLKVLNLNQLLFLFLNLKYYFKFFGTNFFFLKKLNSSMVCSDVSFFNLL